MLVKTNAGEVELTAEMVRPGMVFEDGRRRLTATEHVGGGVFRSSEGIRFAAIAVDTWDMVGCDPTIAARADCERYGIAPGIDAGAHGFARLRDRGAVDLRRSVVNGAVVVAGEDSWGSIRAGERFTNFNAHLRPGDRFIGLDARHARPEDVERLCCGEGAPKWRRTGHPATGDDDVSRPRCTLAIGHDGEHEDLATGVRWLDTPQAVDGRDE